jgi:hypothetical protein
MALRISRLDLVNVADRRRKRGKVGFPRRLTNSKTRGHTNKLEKNMTVLAQTVITDSNSIIVLFTINKMLLEYYAAAYFITL